MLGKSFGNYKVTGHLGKGGMGDVYKARDTRLDRDVAIKVLPPEFVLDRDRLGRFEREAKLLASLNHPNIGSIYGLEEFEGRRGLVLELIDGEDLSARLARGCIPVDDALPIALQIAEGLEAAHECGVVHRDLKPANVMIAGDDRVKLLDFGLAKASEGAPSTAQDLSNSPTLMAHMTEAGMILGTAPYMSPEQARGKVVDKRCDIWAFGCVLYEMLTGAPAFSGSDVAEILSAIIRLEPDLDRLPAGTPPAVRRLIQRCLRKDQRSRLRDVGDARTELDEAIRSPLDVEPDIQLAQSRRTVVPWVIVGVLVATLLGFIVWPSADKIDETPIRRFTIDLPWTVATTWFDFDVVMSSSGTHVAYPCREGNRVSLCVQALDSLSAKPLVDAREIENYVFSPDAEWVALYSNRTLQKVSIRGGNPQTIYRCDGECPWKWISGLSWGEDGYILLGSDSGLYRFAADGGEIERVLVDETVQQAMVGPVNPVHLPGGKLALVMVRLDGEWTAGVVDFSKNTVTALQLRGGGFVYSPTGHIVFRQDTTLLAATFDPEEPSEVGEPIPVLEGVRSNPRIASDGTLAYIPTRGESSARLVWVDREGRPTPIEGERREYSHLALAPDGRKASLDIRPEIYVLDLERGARKLLGYGTTPIWTADGSHVTFWNGRKKIIVSKSADGSGEAEILVESKQWLIPTSWNPATGDLAYFNHSTYEILILPQEGEPFVFLDGSGRKRSGRFSPNGQWMAYVSEETGEYQVYVTAYPGPGPTLAISIDGGLSPIWSPDGQELFFREGSKVMASGIRYEGGIRASAPVELFDGPYTLDLMGHQRFDVTPDGKSFLMVENSDDFPIVVVQNWGAELKGLVPPR